MITARMTAGRRIAASLAVAALAFGVTSCGAINEQATNTDYAASDGVHVDVADAKVRNLLLVTNSDGSEARLIGSVVNDSKSALTLSVEAASTTPVTISVPAEQSVKLEDDANEKIISNLHIMAGEHAETSFTVAGETVDFSVPVVDGTLAEYRDFVPGGSDESVTEHLKATETHSTSGH
ncbi:hypothetical protein QMQ05_02640 [Glutamicibacter ectropisis]|uniref:DNA modification methylase n=1 Tax=Glutamicibacter ectropisis TaxID=3046593 RepID=A0AAU6WFK4_9MICC